MIRFITLLLLLVPYSLLYSQACCTVGTSTLSGVERGVLPSNSLSASFAFHHNILNSAFQSSEENSDPLRRKAKVTNFSFEIEYGLTEKVSVLAMSSYTIRSRETTVVDNETNNETEIELDGSGISDLFILGKYEIITPNLLSPFGLSLGGGIKLPIGDFRKENSGTRLSIDLQPGTGATDVFGWTHFNYSFPSISLSLHANLLYKYSGVNLDSYRYGDEILASLTGTYGLAEFISVGLTIKSRFADEDFWDDRFLPSTGGTYFDLLPDLTYYEGGFSLRVFTQLPVYRNVKGIQLAVSEIYGAEFRYFIDLK